MKKTTNLLIISAILFSAGINAYAQTEQSNTNQPTAYQANISLEDKKDGIKNTIQEERARAIFQATESRALPSESVTTQEKTIDTRKLTAEEKDELLKSLMAKPSP